jgi:hypothetical protein
MRRTSRPGDHMGPPGSLSKGIEQFVCRPQQADDVTRRTTMP